MSVTSNAIQAGTVLQGNSFSYRIIKVLGQGSFGITYLATTKITTQGSLGKMEAEIKVAIKEFFMSEVNTRRDDGSTVEGSTGNVFINYRKKFRKEAENLAKLDHPKIVKVYDVFDANNTTYYVMEYLEGESLDEYIQHRQHLDEEESLMVAKEVGTAIEYMHSKKMLHLDLKPKNVMRRQDGSYTLIDFGLSKQFSDNGDPETSTTIGLGTPGYAPLEQAKYHRDGHFPATLDIYAFGATMYKMLTGQRPPEATTIFEDGFPKGDLRQLGISESTIGYVSHLMQPNRKDRPQTMRETLALLTPDESTRISPPPSDPEVISVQTTKHAQPKALSSKDSTKPNILRPSTTTPEKSDDSNPSSWKTIGIYGGLIVLPVLFFGLVANYFSGRSSSHQKQESIETSISQSADGIENGHEWVDLGLPSGLKWATCNVGANSPEEYGDYFAWGETSTKSEYRGSNSQTDGKNNSWLRSNGYIDSDGNLTLSHDAARQNWGGTWRMPTEYEIKELIANTTTDWTTQGGQYGRLFTSKKNGKSIFLPAAGWRDGGSLNYAGEYGYYWSSTPDERDTLDAYFLYFGSDLFYWAWLSRYDGRSVRAVTE